ncbi:MAG: type IV pilus modification protein PilV [Burkholderiaceae bacterium]|nr:type IV pilus modification protein PilV [Burkholderiaceae bacterium]
MVRLQKPNSAALRQCGGILIEVLISILVCAFALLGFVGMQARATTGEFESYQRSQALVLVGDMASRISANRVNAAAYLVGGLIGAGAMEDCAGLNGAALDLCEWGNLIRGSTEVRGGTNVGSMISARGCIALAAGTTDRYVVSVVWQGVVATGAPTSVCGQGDGAFPTEALRRVVASTVCVPLMVGNAPVGRC